MGDATTSSNGEGGEIAQENIPQAHLDPGMSGIVVSASADGCFNNLTYQLAAEAARIGTWDRDIASNAVMICRIMAQLLDLPPRYHLLSSEEWQNFVLPEDRPAIAQILELPAKDNQVFSFECRVRARSGRIVWLLMRGELIRDPRGRASHITGVAIDITDRKRAEEASRASEDRYRLLSDLSPDGILVLADGRHVYANQAAARMLGVRTPQRLVGTSPADFLDSPSWQLAEAVMQDMLERHLSMPPTVWTARRQDGSAILVQAVAGKVSWEGRPAIQLVLRDVTEQKRTEDKLRLLSDRLKLAVEGAGEGIWDWDLSHDAFTFSGGMRKILDWPEDEEMHQRIDWRALTHRDDLPRVQAAMQACIKDQAPAYQCEYRLRARDGSWKWVLSRGVIVSRDEQGRPLAMTGTLSDITARKESEELVWRHANLDALTGLPNRRHFRERLEIELRQSHRTHRRSGLLFIDLDGFKQVNDLFGHDAGDLLLMETANRIRGCLRETDLIARLGGDEFTVLLTDLSDADHVEFLCQKLLSSLEQPFQIGSDMAYVSASIGVALHPHDAQSAEELIRKADQAMYAAKAAGKNRFSYFTPALDEKAHARLRIGADLRHALVDSQLSLHYQPVIDLADGHIVKAEALLRWMHPTLGAIEPAEFVPIAEEAGLMGQIGNWVFREAATSAKRWSERRGEPFPVGINKSPVQFLPRDLESGWLQYLRESGISGSQIVIEITEGVLLHASPAVLDKLLEYRDAGIQVAIDDFGTGYSSMAYLKKFDIDYLKIDRSFIRDVETDQSGRVITESIIAMAHKLGMKVIAEGVETRGQLDFLTEAGCDYGQGYFFSRPLPSEQMEAMLGRRW